MEEIRKNKRLPEILAPAGSFEIMKQAYQAGADAVYLGGQAFGARAYASNLTEAELIQGIEYAGLHGKKLYLTTNTLVKESEIEALYRFLKTPYEAGLHAVIVQDMGAVSMIREAYPDMEIHASTQMSITTPEACQLLAQAGVCRVVPARELSMDELRKLKENSDTEIEVFVHGALCYSFSGRCLMSSLIGGRSGNRGRCAQPCRQLYKSRFGSDRYLLSPKDLCALENVPQLIEAGVDSFKIEGRMKRAEYVISAVQAYRQAVDAYADRKTFDTDRAKHELADIFNRGGFTEGYFHMHNGKDMMCMERNNHNGILIGTIQIIRDGTITVQLEQNLNSGDILEIRTKNGENIELTSGKAAKAGQTVVLNAIKLRQLQIGNPVYRTKNKHLCEQLLQKNKEGELKEKIHISVILKKDLPAKIIMKCGEAEADVQGDTVLQAMKQPLTREIVKEKLLKLGDTPYEASDIWIDMDEDAFLSMKELNRLRREALVQLEQQYKRFFRREAVQAEPFNQKNLQVKDIQSQSDKRLAVSVMTQEQFRIVLKNEKVQRVDLELEAFTLSQLRDMTEQLHEKQKLAYLALPRCYRQDMQEELLQALQTEADGCLIRTLDEAALYQVSSCRLPMVLDASVYAYNHKAVEAYKQALGCAGVTLPQELNRAELSALLDNTPKTTWEWIIYERPAVMVSAQCVCRNVQGCKKEAASDIAFWNTHQDEYTARPVCKYCYNVIYQQKPVSLLKHRNEYKTVSVCRIVLTTEDAAQTENILSFKQKDACWEGHYRKGID